MICAARPALDAVASRPRIAAGKLRSIDPFEINRLMLKLA
jgi:hypothetical protein